MCCFYRPLLVTIKDKTYLRLTKPRRILSKTNSWIKKNDWNTVASIKMPGFFDESWPIIFWSSIWEKTTKMQNFFRYCNYLYISLKPAFSHIFHKTSQLAGLEDNQCTFVRKFSYSLKISSQRFGNEILRDSAPSKPLA